MLNFFQQVTIVPQNPIDRKSLMYGHRFALDRGFYSTRSGTPGSEHESLSCSPVPHPFTPLPPADNHHRAVQIPPQYPSPVPPPPPGESFQVKIDSTFNFTT